MPLDWTHDDLQQFFFRLGLVLGSYLAYTASGDSLGPGYVTYPSLVEAYQALAACRAGDLSLALSP
jgi:hypothetical protein